MILVWPWLGRLFTSGDRYKVVLAYNAVLAIKHGSMDEKNHRQRIKLRLYISINSVLLVGYVVVYTLEKRWFQDSKIFNLRSKSCRVAPVTSSPTALSGLALIYCRQYCRTVAFHTIEHGHRPAERCSFHFRSSSKTHTLLYVPFSTCPSYRTC